MTNTDILDDSDNLRKIKEITQNIGYYLTDELLRELAEEAMQDWGAEGEQSIANVATLLYDIHSKNLKIVFLKFNTSLEYIQKVKNFEVKTKNTTHRGHTLFCSTASMEKGVAMFTAKMLRTIFNEKTRTYNWEIDEDSIIPLKPFTVRIGKDLQRVTDDMLEQLKPAASKADNYNIHKISRVYNEYFEKI
ncbi:MAG: hypothetical protein FWF50_05790 [Defluviitaleaceae bacterium]|nr:hypothetical protein [Defluviitaleaceae bacterium]